MSCGVDKPWPPGRPSVTSMTRDSVTLTWSPPRNDGGSPVTGYIVESKSSSYYAWTSCSVGVRISEPHYVVPNVVDGTSYEFRVITENRSGRSEPSPPSTPVVVRDTVGQLQCSTHTQLDRYATVLVSLFSVCCLGRFSNIWRLSEPFCEGQMFVLSSNQIVSNT